MGIKKIEINDVQTVFSSSSWEKKSRKKGVELTKKNNNRLRNKFWDKIGFRKYPGYQSLLCHFANRATDVVAKLAKKIAKTVEKTVSEYYYQNFNLQKQFTRIISTTNKKCYFQ